MLIGRSINYDIKTDYRYGAHWREYNRKELEYLLESNGFLVKDVRYCDFSYPGQKQIIKLINSVCGSILSTLRGNIVVIAQKEITHNP